MIGVTSLKSDLSYLVFDGGSWKITLVASFTKYEQEQIMKELSRIFLVRLSRRISRKDFRNPDSTVLL